MRDGVCLLIKCKGRTEKLLTLLQQLVTEFYSCRAHPETKYRREISSPMRDFAGLNT